MLLSEIGDKEIVDIVKGSMHGKLWDAEMLFDEQTGVIKSLLIPKLPWNSIVVIGEDMIIFRSN